MFDYKNADKVALQAEWKRIAQLSGDDQFFTKKELNYLPELLQEGEQVLCFSSGLMDNKTWLLALTDTRIIFINKGIIYGTTHSITNLDKVNSIEGNTGLIFGDIAMNDGAVMRKITNVPKKTVKNFVNAAQDAMMKLRNKASQQSAPASDNVADQLMKLAELKEKGILSEDEFNTQKAKILGG